MCAPKTAHVPGIAELPAGITHFMHSKSRTSGSPQLFLFRLLPSLAAFSIPAIYFVRSPLPRRDICRARRSISPTLFFPWCLGSLDHSSPALFPCESGEIVFLLNESRWVCDSCHRKYPGASVFHSTADVETTSIFPQAARCYPIG